MLLRWIVNNYLRDAAEGKVREVVSGLLDPAEEAPVDRVRQSASGTRSAPDQAGGEAGPPEEIIPCEAAFLFGSSVEAGGLVDLLQGSERSKHAHGIEHAGKLGTREVVIVESGVGARSSARAAAEAIKFYEPKWVIAAGFCSALGDDLLRGHLVLADTIVGESGQELATGMKLDPASLSKGVHVGRVLSVAEEVRRPEDRRRLGEAHRAIACDMESLAIAEACRQHHRPMMSVRIVTDAVDDELPREIAHLLAQKTWAAKAGATAGALLNRFSAAKDLWQLREDALKASDRLAKFLKGMVAQLPR